MALAAFAFAGREPLALARVWLLVSEFNLKRLGKNQRLFSALAVQIEAGRHATISRLQPRRLG